MFGGASTARESSSFLTDFNLDEVLRRGKWFVGLISKKGGHDAVPDGRGAGDTGGDVGHGG